MHVHRRTVLGAFALAPALAILPGVHVTTARADNRATSTDPVVDEILGGDPRISYLGTPVRSQITGVPCTGVEDGRAVAYQMFKGIGDSATPGTFVVFDIETGETLRTFPIEGVDNNWGITRAADDRVYVATYHDYGLHRYDPIAKTMTNLGPINAEVPEDGYPWSMSPGPGNSVFIGTYRKGDLWQYHPDTDTYENWGHDGWGPSDPNQTQYVRQVAWDEANQSVLLSTGSFDPAVYRVDVATREVTRLTNDTKQPGLSTESFISAVTVIGDRIVARGYHSKKLLVMDSQGNTEYWGNEGGTISVHGHRFAQHPTDPDLILFTNGKLLMTYSVSTQTIAATGADLGNYYSDSVVSPTDPNTLLGVTGNSTFVLDLDNPTSPTLHAFSFSQPAILETVLTGPDNTMWAGGYMSSLAQVDTTGDGHLYPTLQVARQYESGIVRDGLMYLGAYTGSSFQSFDPKTPTVAPRTLYTAQSIGFDRPITMTYDSTNDKAYMGSIPGYGLNQGGLSVWNFATSKATHFRTEVMADQGVSSALFHPDTGMVYLGTNVDGGNGHPDSGLTEGYLITWDPTTDTKVSQLVPVPDRRGITGLALAPDGKVWGIAEDLLFVYDPATDSVERTVRILGSGYGDGNHWSWGYMALSPKDGRMYASLGSRLVVIDPDTFEFSNIGVGKGSRMHLDDEGNVYFLAFYGSQHLFKYEPASAAPDTTAPVVTVTVADADPASVTLTADDQGSGVAMIEYRIGSDPWTTYTEPLTLERKDRPVIRARATDNAGNVSRIRATALRPIA